MISLDTNFIQSFLNPNDVNHDRALHALLLYRTQALCICPPVRTELRASRFWNATKLWLEHQEVSTLWEMPESVWDNAGIAFGNYATLRRAGKIPRRIVADFLIAAHAEHHQLEVLTFDDTVFTSVFPKIKLLPSSE
jgi:predicted nucleic acid-binding protein